MTYLLKLTWVIESVLLAAPLIVLGYFVIRQAFKAPTRQSISYKAHLLVNERGELVENGTMTFN